MKCQDELGDIMRKLSEISWGLILHVLGNNCGICMNAKL